MKGNSRREKKGDRLELLANVGRVSLAETGYSFTKSMGIPGCGISDKWIRLYNHMINVRQSSVLVVIDRNRGNTIFLRPSQLGRLRISGRNHDCFLVDRWGVFKLQKIVNTDVSRKAIQG